MLRLLLELQETGEVSFVLSVELFVRYEIYGMSSVFLAEEFEGLK
jgi:hypothetical protein